MMRAILYHIGSVRIIYMDALIYIDGVAELVR